MPTYSQALGSYIARRREELGLTQRDVAAALGYGGPQFISNIERGLAGLPLRQYRKLARALSVSLEGLLEATVPPAELGAAREHFGLAAQPSQAEPALLPLLAEVECNQFIWAESFEDAPEQVSVGERLYRPGRFALRARGDSMRNEIKQGDLCVFDPSLEPRNGSIVVAQLTGEAEGSTIKWYIDYGSYVELRPENINRLYKPLVLIRRGQEYLFEGDKRVQLLIKGVMAGLIRQY
jgi:SOS-response transcriptional repressor LexA